MRKVVCIIVSIITLFSLVSCSGYNSVDLTAENARDYLALDVSFGELTITETSGTSLGKYFLQCMGQISVKARSNYAFSNASIACVIPKRIGIWLVKPTTSDTTSVISSDYINIHLDKDGNGVVSLYLSCYSDEYSMKHPSFFDFSFSIGGAEGTITYSEN